MSTQSKVSTLQAYNMLLYRNALHPEFFGIEGRQRIDGSEYEFESWIFRGGHALRFQIDSVCLTEIVSDEGDTLPERGLVGTFQCAGEKDHDARFGDRLTYVTSMQTEILTDHLYLNTYNEMVEHGRRSDALLSVWTDTSAGKPNLSLVDCQRFATSIHVQGFHLRSDCGLVLRTQTIFEVREDEG